MAGAAGCVALASYRIKALNELKRQNYNHLPYASDARANNTLSGQEEYFYDIPPNWESTWGFPWEQLTAHQLRTHLNIEIGGMLGFCVLALVSLILASRQKRS